MSIKLGVVMDPIADIAFKKDTSLALLHAAQERGCELFYMEQSDLSIQNGKAMGRMAPLKVAMNPDHWFDLGDYREQPLAEQLQAQSSTPCPPPPWPRSASVAARCA